MWVLNPKDFPMTSAPSVSTVLGAEFQAVLREIRELATEAERLLIWTLGKRPSGSHEVEGRRDGAKGAAATPCPLGQTVEAGEP